MFNVYHVQSKITHEMFIWFEVNVFVWPTNSSITLHSYLKIEPNWRKATPSKKECMTIIW